MVGDSSIMAWLLSEKGLKRKYVWLLSFSPFLPSARTCFLPVIKVIMALSIAYDPSWATGA